MNLSYHILHFNRPYMLKLHVELIRHFCPDVELVVSDDGSSQEVYQFIQKLPIDKIFRPKRKRGQHTASQTIQHGVNLCARDHYLFTEDDFLYAATFLPSHRWIRKPKIYWEGGTVVPDIKFGTPIPILEQSMLKIDRDNMHVVQLAHKCGIGSALEQLPLDDDGQMRWDSRPTRPNNWPWMCKTSFRKQMKLPNFMNISDTQKWIRQYQTSVYQPLKICRPMRPCFAHAGNLFSVNSSSRRNMFFNSIWGKVLRKEKPKTSTEIQSFLDYLISQTLQGKFNISIDLALSKGLNAAFVSALEAIGI